VPVAGMMELPRFLRREVHTGIGPAGPEYLDGLVVTVQAPEELSPLPAAVEVAAYRIAAEALTNVSRHARALAGRGRLAWRRTGRQGSHSLSSSSACLVRGAVVTCSCWNWNRSTVLSLTDSVWLPAANTTVSCWSTSGST
jgi:hypothetical protein